MTTLLTDDEAARLRVGVNVIVRPGDADPVELAPDPPSGRKRWRYEYVAPQDWVALTGACPQPSAAYAMTICSRCGHMRLSWDSPCHCPVTVPMVSWIGYCDWGSCNQPTARWRFDDDAGWLPVCAEHGRRIVPLYRECPHPRGVCVQADCDGLLLVGRGSIEVVPVVAHGVEIAVAWIPHIAPDQHGQWFIWHGPNVEAGENLTTGRYDWKRTRIALDPLPVPGRDWGILIDCVEVAP